MSPNHLLLRLSALAFVTFGLIAGRNVSVVGQEPAEFPEGVEVQTRGPMHEAFGVPVTFDAKSGIVVNKEPPKSIEELPPDQKPEGENVAWIGGYWAWDADRKDFLWVSGIWRHMPPGRQWMPGYWSKVSDGWQWISGFWASADVTETEYFPEPPASVEVGPSSEAPSDEYIWAPGSWEWNDRYVWRPGSWVEARSGWNWIPPCYSYTPSGYVHVDGYWDYSFRRRGTLFAPVYYETPIYTRPDYYYSPSVAIDLDVITDHFFCYPRYRHYYYGDYYGSDYYRGGIYPWFSFHRSRHGYDPCYAYYSWHYRRHGHRDWHDRLHHDYRHRRDHDWARPARTWDRQRALAGRNRGDRERVALARPLAQVAGDRNLRLERVSRERRDEIQRQTRAQRDFRQARATRETQVAARSPASRSRDGAKPVKLSLPKSPVAAKASAAVAPDRTPPPRVSRSRVEANRRTDTQSRTEPRSDQRSPAATRGRVEPTRPAQRPESARQEPRREIQRRETRQPARVEPRREAPRAEPRRDVARSEPRHEVRRIEPRREAPRAEPRLERREAARVEPRREPPRLQQQAPRPEAPKAQSRPAPRPQAPRVQSPAPRREAPRAQSRAAPRPQAPRIQSPAPRREAPRAQSRAAPRPQAPRVQSPAPRREAPRAQPRAAPRAQPRSAPRAERRPAARSEPRRQSSQGNRGDSRKNRK